MTGCECSFFTAILRELHFDARSFIFDQNDTPGFIYSVLERVPTFLH